MSNETIVNNIKEALRIMEDEPHRSEAALWRLVDASGLLAREHPHVTGTKNNPSGRGFYVAHDGRVW